jgi:hypothetical protein
MRHVVTPFTTAAAVVAIAAIAVMPLVDSRADRNTTSTTNTVQVRGVESGKYLRSAPRHDECCGIDRRTDGGTPRWLSVRHSLPAEVSLRQAWPWASWPVCAP